VSNFISNFSESASLKDYSRLVLLAGPPRSGTTWLNRELCNETNVFPFLPECTLLTQQVELYSRTLHYCDPQRFNAYFADKQNLQAYYRKNVVRMLNQIVAINRKPKADTLILKDPGLSLYLDEIKDLFPPYKMIVLVRDPRDVLASMKNVTHRKQKQWDLQDASIQLFSYYHKIGNYQQHADQDCITVRYEDLVVGKTATLQDFLHQPVLQNVFRDSNIAAVRDQLSTTDPFFSDLYLQPTTQKQVGSYREILSVDEVRHVESVYSGVIQRWGY
jgi:hypothetical protein